jgi:cyclopropane-fatty-acyl-phospholipid synthase
MNGVGRAQTARRQPTATWLMNVARRVVFSALSRITSGAITVIDGGDQYVFGQISHQDDLHVTVTIRDARCYLNVAISGTIGAGESYGRGDWECDELTTLVRLFVLNRSVLDDMERGPARIGVACLRALHRCRRNTPKGSRTNVAAHYDLSNEFFALMLDQTMMYSCAYFHQNSGTLAQASSAKNELICEKLAISSRDRVLEIGTGWGGFALYAAQHRGCRITTVTISQSQYERAAERIAAAGLSDRVTLLLMDYRDLPSLNMRFDKVVSIEMIEAVGHEYYRTFFEVCSRMLKPSGLMLMQAITIDERQYRRAKRAVDFIQWCIFPGSCIPSLNALCAAMADASDLNAIHLQDIGAHYPPTLKAWRRNIGINLQRIGQLGFSDEFIRRWEFYLCYCEGGFLERSISAVHLLFAKPAWRPMRIEG